MMMMIQAWEALIEKDLEEEWEEWEWEEWGEWVWVWGE